MSSIPTTMRALEQPTLTGPQDLRLITDAPVPTPGPGEILVRVIAAGVNFSDTMQTRGTYDNGPQAPYIAGFEAAGEIVALGEGVTGLDVGTHVIGVGAGAYAEYMLMPAVAVGPIPDGWTDEQAIGLVLNWATALAALKPLGRIAEGDVVLVHAAAGGVGQAAVRMAKHYGATVIGTASAAKHETVLGIGADHVVDYNTQDVAEEVLRLTDGRGADIVLESVGGDTFQKSLAATKRTTGKVIIYGVAAGVVEVSNWDLNFTHQIALIGLHLGVLIETAPEIFGEIMGELSALIAAGVYPPGRPTIYSLDDGAKALADLESRATIGKLVIKP